MIFSTDSKHLAYKARLDSGSAYVLLVDHRPGPPFEWIGKTGCFTGRGIEYLAKKGLILYRVTQAL